MIRNEVEACIKCITVFIEKIVSGSIFIPNPPPLGVLARCYSDEIPLSYDTIFQIKPVLPAVFNAALVVIFLCFLMNYTFQALLHTALGVNSVING